MADPHEPNDSIVAAMDIHIDLMGTGDGSGNDSLDVDRIVSSTLEHLDQMEVGEDSGDSRHAAARANPDSPLFVSQGTSSTTVSEVAEALYEDVVKRDGIAVIVPPVQNRWEYCRYEDPMEVVELLEEYDDGGLIEYLVRKEDGMEEVLSFDQVRQLHNGPTLLADFDQNLSYNSDSTAESLESAPETSSRHSRRSKDLRKTHISQHLLSSDDELISAHPPLRRGRPRARLSTASGKVSSARQRLSRLTMESSTDDSRRRSTRSTRAGARRSVNYSDVGNLDELYDDYEGFPPGLPSKIDSGPTKRRKLLRGPRPPESSIADDGLRRSGRNLHTHDMRERGEDDIPDKATATNALPKYVGAQESFKALPEDNEFRKRHCQKCETCMQAGNSENKGALVYCQGCIMSYHQKCLGPRNTREHLVTKIGDMDSVLQCRRCIGVPKQKDQMAPDQGLCYSCHERGAATSAFRRRKTTKQEQEERETNGGQDTITDVPSELINSPENLLFRCWVCFRGCHLHHLPARSSDANLQGLTDSERGAELLEEYNFEYLCKDCISAPGLSDSIVAWRPIDVDSYEPGQTTAMLPYDKQEYLIKWKKLPYTDVSWVPGDWFWGVMPVPTRNAFMRLNNHNNLPTMSTEEAVPEDFMRVDNVLDVMYSDVVKKPSEEVAKARIKEVLKAFVKFKGLGYEDAVWIYPPGKDEVERWADYQAAYDDWAMGSFVISPPPKRDLETRLTKLRSQNFEKDVVLKDQPESLVGGKLMTYQMEGLNWIYYQWFHRQNAILADEMGLGKTIQVIAFLATLKELHTCWPFLIVVPNSTCPNWRREIKRWVPSLRVVTHYGTAESRDLSLQYELFSKGSKNLSCHVVVTSYDTAQDVNFRKTFRGVNWAGLIVDEGQRLKNDKNILYQSLNSLKIPFKLLLTGTPLQNNARELFNLLQFLDPSVDAQAMEVEYATLTQENIVQLHAQLRGMFLRRTKAQVLDFLPPMAQIILPVTMSVLQKELYKSILAQNPELIRSIIGTRKTIGSKEKQNLNNLLIQLRKCLVHPFVYSKDIEERSEIGVNLHRNLVEASSKLQLLEIMLPKLHERGHRVLIFSQWLEGLDIVEDFLDGLGLHYLRLDGRTTSLQKQKRIDEFNAPDSPLFAFLLSTRAGGVGINLATADTVIILDPDFNPHQDIQAISRAHRIGQKKKVLVFQLMTRATVEEKIMQVGKKKMALDHIMIEQREASDDAGLDLESILKHGADALFKDDASQDIKYEAASVDRLLDRSQIESTQTDDDKTAESQFSFARIWANDKGSLEENRELDDETEMDPSIWENILKEREREAKETAAAKAEALGRGRRKRRAVDYALKEDAPNEGAIQDGPLQDGHKQASSAAKKSRQNSGDDDDTDYQEREDETDDVNYSEEHVEVDVQDDEQVLEAPPPRRPRPSASQALPAKNTGRTFQRAVVPPVTSQGVPSYPPEPRHVPPYPQPAPQYGLPASYPPPTFTHIPATTQAPSHGNGPAQPGAQMPLVPPAYWEIGQGQPGALMQPVAQAPHHGYDGADDLPILCIACDKIHKEGYCPLKLAGVEFCGLCGLAHYGHARTCPHLQSVTQLRLMVDALKRSPEPKELKDLALSKIRGIIGDLNQRKRRAAEAAERKNASRSAPHAPSGNLPSQHPPNGNLPSQHPQNGNQPSQHPPHGSLPSQNPPNSDLDANGHPVQAPPGSIDQIQQNHDNRLSSRWAAQGY